MPVGAEPSLRRQLRLLEVYAAFTYPFACIPFLYFFFRDHGVGVDGYHWLISIYYLTMVVAEVPTGVIADRFGRRGMMILGPLLLATGFLTLFFWRTFAGFCVGEIVFGLGHSVLSGPPTALLYDTLRRHGRQGRFMAEEGRIHALRLFGTGGAFLLGGAVASLWGIGPTIVLTAALQVVAVVAGVLLVDVRADDRPAEAPPLWRVAAADLRVPAVLWVTAYFVLVFFLLRYVFHTYQPFLEAAKQENTLLIGGLYFVLNLVAAPCSRLAPHAVRRFGERAVFAALPVALAGSLFVQAAFVGPIGIAMLLAHQVPFGLHWPLIQGFVNHRIGSAARATVLSVMSLAGRLAFTAGFPLIGVFTAAHGLPATYVTVGAIALAATLACLLAARKILTPARAGDPTPAP